MRFPAVIRTDFVNKNRQNLIKMSASQALIFNYLNAIELDFAMGYDLFTEGDHLIPIRSVKMFFLSTGADLLSKLHGIYYNHEFSMNQAFFVELSKKIRCKTLEEARRLANLVVEEEN